MAHMSNVNVDAIFQSVDTDRSGSISANELQRALYNGGWTAFNPETVRLLIGMFDKNNSGQIDREEFFALWKYVNDWQSCFRCYDKDNSGTISESELKFALTTFGYRLSDGFYKLMMRRFDRTGRGDILFDDFIQCAVVLHTLTQAFRQHDVTGTGTITIGFEQFLTMVLSLHI